MSASTGSPKAPWWRRRPRGLLAVMLLGVFAAGFAAGALKLPPHAWLRSLRDSVRRAGSGDAESDLLRVAFAAPLLPGEQILEPCRSLAELEDRLAALRIDAGAIFGGYERLAIAGVESRGINSGRERILEVAFALGEHRGVARAYAAVGPPTVPLPSGDAAVLIIPGTGFNRSSAILERRSGDYHGDLLGAVDGVCEPFILIKPNEDCLAIHDGRRKLADEFIVPYLINRSSSYSTLYLVHALAILKHLETAFARTAVVGLSQGGEAALYVALEARPQAAVVASGYAASSARIEWKGIDQIIVPGLAAAYAPERVRRSIEAGPTRFLFTWGRREDAFFGLDASRRATEAALAGLGNVSCMRHDGGHTLPVVPVRAFLADALAAKQAMGGS